MVGLSNVLGLKGVNFRQGVQSKRKCESHKSCICIVGFSTCGCEKKSKAYEMECRGPEVFKVLKCVKQPDT